VAVFTKGDGVWEGKERAEAQHTVAQEGWEGSFSSARGKERENDIYTYSYTHTPTDRQTSKRQSEKWTHRQTDKE
jgi:hypothetical protein